MTSGALLDTNSLLWSGNATLIRQAATAAIVEARQNGKLFISAISIWELTFAARKRYLPSRPDLRGLSPRTWFDGTIQRLGATVLPIDTNIADEAAWVAVSYGNGDPGDCIVIATAHLNNLTLITRDARILEFAQNNPAYLTAIRC